MVETFELVFEIVGLCVCYLGFVEALGRRVRVLLVLDWKVPTKCLINCPIENYGSKVAER